VDTAISGATFDLIVSRGSPPNGKPKLRVLVKSIFPSSDADPFPIEAAPTLVDRDRASKGACKLSVSLCVCVMAEEEVLDLRRNGRVTSDDILAIPNPPWLEVGLAGVADAMVSFD
jgi:hypothetical protein